MLCSYVCKIVWEKTVPACPMFASGCSCSCPLTRIQSTATNTTRNSTITDVSNSFAFAPRPVLAIIGIIVLALV
jgi:hypothetical protein